jgi:ketosteroid isomerase-like protein
MVRFPGAWRALAVAGSTLLSPRSRLRRAMVCREVVSAWQATSRRDFELVQVRYARDPQLEFDPDFEGVGFAGPFGSVTEREQAFQQEWQRFEAVPAAVVDLGDRLVVLGTVRLTGKGSGVELESEVAQLVTAPRGLAARDQIFLSWERGLRAAGLDPDEVISRVAAAVAELPDVVVTGVEQRGPPRRSRNLEERLMVRFPGVYRAVAALVWCLLSSRSRLRRVLLRRTLISAYAAASRRDYELMLVRYAPDVAVEFDTDFAPLGLSGTHRGHDGLVRLIDAWGVAWEEWAVVPAAVIDMGDRVLFFGHTRLPGTASGLELEGEFAQLITLRRGLVAHEREFVSWEQGLLAARLDPDAVALPSRGKTGQVASGPA